MGEKVRWKCPNCGDQGISDKKIDKTVYCIECDTYISWRDIIIIEKVRIKK
jgi:uncharacterized Zn finger protein